MIAQTHRELRSDIEKYGRELSGDCRVKRVRVCAQGRDSVVGKCAKIKGPHRSEYKNKNDKCIGYYFKLVVSFNCTKVATVFRLNVDNVKLGIGALSGVKLYLHNVTKNN